MKENLRRLQLIFRFTRLKPEMFYAIRIGEYTIVLQGSPSSELDEFMRDNKIKNEVMDRIKIVQL